MNCDVEIGDVRVTHDVEEDIIWLYIAMNDELLVKIR